MDESGRRFLPPLLVFLLTLASAVVVLAGMRAAQGIISGFFLAVVLAICLGPAQTWLIGKGIPRWLAFLIVLGGTLLFLAGLLALMVVGFAQVLDAIPQYESQLNEAQKQIQSTLDSLGFSASSSASAAQHAANPKALATTALAVVEWVISGISGFVIMLILFAFMLLDASGFPSRLRQAFSPVTYYRFADFSGRLRRFVVLTSIVNGLVAIFNTIFLMVMGVQFAVLWGVLSFFLGFIPNIGFVLSLIGPAIMALLQFGWGEALVVIGVFIVINGAVSNIVQPKLMGTGLDLQPFMVTASVIFWGFILGPIGAILSVPMTLLVRFLLESWPETTQLSRMIGTGRAPVDDQPAAEAETTA